jgi:hypothetical protein
MTNAWITDLDELQEYIAEELPACSRAMRALYAATAFPPELWRATTFSDGTAQFWAVARYQGRVLWYNHYEAGFNVSPAPRLGEIAEYWCNPDNLQHAMPRFAGRPGRGPRLGPPQPLGTEEF